VLKESGHFSVFVTLFLREPKAESHSFLSASRPLPTRTLRKGSGYPDRPGHHLIGENIEHPLRFRRLERKRPMEPSLHHVSRPDGRISHLRSREMDDQIDCQFACSSRKNRPGSDPPNRYALCMAMGICPSAAGTPSGWDRKVRIHSGMSLAEPGS